MPKPVTGLTVFENNTTNSLVNLDANFTALANAINDPGSYSNYGVDSGSVNALVVTLTGYVLSAYADGQIYVVKVANTNTTTATLNINSLGAKTIFRKDGSALLAGDLIATNDYQFIYNSSLSGFQLLGSLPLSIQSTAAGNVIINVPSSGTALSATGASGANVFVGTTAGSGTAFNAVLNNSSATALNISVTAATQVNALSFAQSGQTAWQLYQPPSSSDLRFLAGADRVVFAAAGDLYQSPSGSQAAGSTTTQFFHIKNASAAPTGVPATLITGNTPLIFDATVNDILFSYITLTNGGSAWIPANGVLPVTNHTANYGFLAGDIGTEHNATSGTLTFTIPANSAVSYPPGTTICGYNSSGNNLTIAITTDTLHLDNSASTGSRTVPTNCFYTLNKVGTTSWVILGAGIT